MKPDRMSAVRGLSEKLLGQMYLSWSRNEAQRDLSRPQQLHKTGHLHAQTHRWLIHFLLANFQHLYLIPDSFFIVSCLNLKFCLMWCVKGRAVHEWITCRSDWHIYQPEQGRLRWAQTYRGPQLERKTAEWKVTFNTATTWPDFSIYKSAGHKLLW